MNLNFKRIIAFLTTAFISIKEYIQTREIEFYLFMMLLKLVLKALGLGRLLF